MTGGGADYCFECVGMATLVQEAYASCRKVSLFSLYPSPSIYLPLSQSAPKHALHYGL